MTLQELKLEQEYLDEEERELLEQLRKGDSQWQ